MTAGLRRHAYFDSLLDALTRPGCPLCALVARTRWRYLDALAYENVNDIAIRAKLRTSLGFCNRHAWYFLEQVREPVGAAIIYRDLLHTIQRRGAASDEAFAPGALCLACAIEREMTDDLLGALTQAVGDAEFRAAYGASDGLCAPHLRLATAALTAEARGKLLDLAGIACADTVADPRHRREFAAGAPQNTGADEVALVGEGIEPEAYSPASQSPPREPFTCAVCAAVGADLAAFTSWDELDDGSGGLCNVHAWRPAGEAAATIYRRQITAIRDEAVARRAIADSPLTLAMRSLGLARPSVGPPEVPLRCVACARQGVIEEYLVVVAPAPFCVPHLRRALRQGRADTLEATRPIWHELDHHLGEYIRKEDYRFRGEPRGLEQSSPRWAVALIAGESGIR
ncbi:MAG TPA: hypothetical protein VFZ25_00635 [Chloroflexota bacterium]|nr:hypothetical protein [Chloroflexota bacterium]